MMTDRTLRRSGTREELIAELYRLSEGWYHLAKDNKHQEALRGAYELQRGAPSIQVGHTVYEATES